MKYNRNILLIIGFIAGLIYAGCGGAGGVVSSVAQALGMASEVSYDSSSSGLSATTAQGAFDELDSSIDTLSGKLKTGDDLKSLITGSWSGSFQSGITSVDITMRLNSDGSFACTNSDSDAFGSICDDSSASWSMLTRIIKIEFVDDQNDDKTTFFYPSYASSSTLELSDGVQKVYLLTKSE